MPKEHYTVLPVDTKVSLLVLPVDTKVYPVKTTGYRAWANKPVRLAELVVVDKINLPASVVLPHMDKFRDYIWQYACFANPICEPGVPKKEKFCGFVYNINDVIEVTL